MISAPVHATCVARPGIARTDTRPDHRDERCADAERNRNQQIFEPRAGAETGDRRRTGRRTDEARRERNRHVRLQRNERRYRTDAQN